MRSVLGLMVAALLAGGGTTAGSVICPALDRPAFAQQAKPPAKKPPGKQRSQRSTYPPTTGFEHQQCTVKDPCSTRNQH
jgi:hypothetical protein